MTMAALTFHFARRSSFRDSVWPSPVIAVTMRVPRSRSFSEFACTSTIRFPYVLPTRIMALVVSRLSAILVAVPAFSRVDPAMTSGPTFNSTSTSTSSRMSEPGLQVIPITCVPARLARARRAGTHVMGITCSPGSDMRELVDVLVELNVGPEVIAGSTRLKAGTATKIALNLLTTSAMIRVGKTYGNLMVDVKANSAKLRDRGTRIVSAITNLGHDESLKLLRRAKWNVKAAIVMHKQNLTYGDATIR